MRKTMPEWLKPALEGGHVRLRSGLQAVIRHREEGEVNHPLLGYILAADGRKEAACWTLCGAAENSRLQTPFDIVGMTSVEFEHWDLLRDNVKAIAKDADGRWFGYTSRSIVQDEDRWRDLMGLMGESLASLNSRLFPNCQWKQSLIKRPEEKDNARDLKTDTR